MYRAIGDASFQDGVFSRGAEQQAYQSSVQQFADGSLGRLQSSAYRSRRAPHPGMLTPGRPVNHPVTNLQAVKDGVLGRVQSSAPRVRRVPHPGMLTPGRPVSGLGNTFLPAFTEAQMKGLGYVFRDGVLGEDATIPGVTISTTPPAPAKWAPDLASIGIGVVAGGLLFYALKAH